MNEQDQATLETRSELARAKAFALEQETRALNAEHALEQLQDEVVALRQVVAELRSPAHILAAAERLLREAGVSRVLLSRDRPNRSGEGMRERHCTVEQFGSLYSSAHDCPTTPGTSLAEAYAKLKEPSNA